jgi:phosphoglycerate dehydrogenase-like enzyme
VEALSPGSAIAVLPDRFRPLLEGRLPEGIEPRWWGTAEQLEALAPEARIGWFDLFGKAPALRALASATGLEWLNTAFSGVDWLPLDDLRARGVALTNGSGVNAITVAEFAVLGMLAIARDYRGVALAQARGEWLRELAEPRELAGSRALLLGYGAIGSAIGTRLAAFGVEVVPVRSRAGKGALGPDEWRAQIGSFDWIILTLPATTETAGMIGTAELASMSSQAVLVNLGRAECVDQLALIDALRERRVAAALLDLTDPEPLPPGDPLWSLENAHITMHRAGLPNAATRHRAAERFRANCMRFLRGEELEARVDLARGY